MTLRRAAVLALLLSPLVTAASTTDDVGDECDELAELVEGTYGFHPTELTDAERERSTIAMDVVWDLVLSSPDTLVPCLVELLQADDADPWFRLDGSALLVQADPSPEHRALQVQLWSEADLDGVDPRTWLETLALLGLQGLDVSLPARRWVSEGRAFGPDEPGAWQVGPLEGALMLYGSMDEALATPALLQLFEESKDPRVQMVALQLLAYQATGLSWEIMSGMDPAGLPEEARDGLTRMVLTDPPPVPEPTHLLGRERLVAALERCAEEGAPPLPADFGVNAMEWATNLCHELEADDLDVLRRARRRLATRAEQESIMLYMILSSVLNYHVRD